MSKHSAILLIQDMLEAIEKIRRYTERLTLETFQADEKSVDAVARNLEIIGEAASRLPEKLIISRPKYASLKE